MIVVANYKHLIDLIYQKVTNHSKSLDEVLDLSDIDVSNVTSMYSLFCGDLIDANCSNDPVEKELIHFFNKKYTVNVSGWNTANVTDMSLMFNASNINIDISHFDTSSVKTMKSMFYESSFNGDISSWDTSNVEDMQGVFGCSYFNQDISSWNTYKVKNMSHMFSNASFNKDISKWDVSNVERMDHMFECSSFNHDISSWDFSSVRYFSGMFNFGYAYSYSIDGWNIHPDADSGDIFDD